MKSLATAKNWFIRSRKLSRRSPITRPWWEHSYKRLSKGETGERAVAATDQRNLTPTVSIADIAVKVENDCQDSVMKLDQAHNVSAKTVHGTLYKNLPLPGSRPAEQSNCFTRRWRKSDPEHAKRPQRWLPWLFDHLEQLLAVGGSAANEKRAVWPQPQSGGLPEGLRGGIQKIAQRWTSLRHSGSSKNSAKNTWTQPGPTLKKLKINAPLSMTF